MRQKTQAGPEDSSERKSRDAQDKKCIFKRQSCNDGTRFDSLWRE